MADKEGTLARDASRRVALVTGASRGIGRAVACGLAVDGFDLALVYAGNADAAADAVAACEAAGATARAYRCDVSNADEVKATADAVLADFGSVWALVNNAGITRDTLLARMKDEDFARVLEVNLTGAFNMMRALTRPLMRQRGGRIVSMSSVVGLMGNAGQANYAASKAGLIGLTISLAAQETASNIFSGIVILIDKPFAVGDWILVGDVEGEVIDINFRSTRIRSQDKTVSIVTNSKICSSTVQNAALRTMRPYKFTLGVTYNTTRPQLEKLMADLTAMLKASPDAYEDTAFVRMTGFGDSSINLMVSAYLRTADYGVFLRMQNDLNLNIMDVMKADGVEFAFPSTTVYLEKEG